MEILYILPLPSDSCNEFETNKISSFKIHHYFAKHCKVIYSQTFQKIKLDDLTPTEDYSKHKIQLFAKVIHFQWVFFMHNVKKYFF